MQLLGPSYTTAARMVKYGKKREKRKTIVKKPSQHSQSLQRDAKLRKLADRSKKKSRKMSRNDMEVVDDSSSTMGGSVANSEYENKEEARLARKKLNAHKVNQYKKMNFSRTNKHGHRAV